MSKNIVSYIFEEYTNEISNKVKHINSGGCGIFAERLYTTLLHLGLNPILMVITNNIEEMEKRVDHVIDKGFDDDLLFDATIKHIVVYLDGLYLDSAGAYDKWTKTGNWYEAEITKCLNIEVLRVWNSDNAMWNSLFDRKHVPMIDKKFNKIKKKVEKIFA